VSSSEKLVSALWNLFRGEISTGDPVFFCFSQETMQEELLTAGFECDSPLQAICDVAHTCFKLDGHFAVLRPEALSPMRDGMSMSIVLVCQQVLAVEEMMRDRGGFSEHAYFPRLRALMSVHLPTLSMNPFRFGDFQSIWKQFAREIHSIKGCSSATITFKFGEYSGVNKARLFPLSQALLSRADLLELTTRTRAERLRTGSASEIWNEILRARGYLSRRAQLAFLRERVVEQAQRFARRRPLSASIPAVPSVSLDRLQLGFCLDAADWLNEEYRAFMMLKGTSSPIGDDVRVKEKLNEALADQGYMICALGESRDFWLLEEGEAEISPGETALLVANGPGLQRARLVLDGLVPPLRMEEDQIKSVGSSSETRACPVVVPSARNAKVRIRKGKIVHLAVLEDAVGGYEWIGGACVDARSRKYLRHALPTAVRFGAQELSTQEVTRVGNAGMKWDALETMIEKLVTDAVFDLRFVNGKVARLAVAVLPRVATERMGFPLDASGRLAPTLVRIGESDDAVVGFAEPIAPVLRPMETHAMAKLVRDLVARPSQKLTGQESLNIWRRVETSYAPDGVKQLIKRLL
jgi:hypothetical protein